MSRLRSGQQGFSLVELLVVMVLLAIVGSIATVGLVRGSQADRQVQSRIEALEDMQIVLERISREVRSASTPLSSAVFADTAVLDDGDWIEVDAGDWIEVDVLHSGDGDCIRYTYWVDANNDLRVSEEVSTDGCQNFGTATDRVLLAGLAPSPPGDTVFSFQTNAYDAARNRQPATDVDEIRFVEISLARTLVDQDPLTMSTVVGLRNTR